MASGEHGSYAEGEKEDVFSYNGSHIFRSASIYSPLIAPVLGKAASRVNQHVPLGSLFNFEAKHEYARDSSGPIIGT